VFPGRDAAAADQGSCARAVLVPAAEGAGLTGVRVHTLHHTCASMLIESGLSPLRLQRWMDDHSPAFTLETYGHLIDGDLGPPLDLRNELGLDRDATRFSALVRPWNVTAVRWSARTLAVTLTGNG